MSDKPRVYILLPVHNRYQLTNRFMICLQAQTYDNFHTLLIDDGSTDGTEYMVRSMLPSVTVIKGNGNWWWAGALEQGFRWLKTKKVLLSDYVLIINDDTEFDADFLSTGVQLLREKKKSLISAYLYDCDNKKELLNAGIYLDWKGLGFGQAIAPEFINCMSTRCIFLRVGDLFKIGGFRPKLLPHYLSDYEFTLRAKRKGYSLCYDSRLSIYMEKDKPGELNRDTGMFSKKSPQNPIYWTIFIALACPWRWKMKNWIRIWKSVCRVLIINKVTC